MIRAIILAAILLTPFFVSSNASAQVLANTTLSGTSDFMATLAFSDVDYDNEKAYGNTTIERTILAGSFAMKASSDFDFMGQFGFIMDSEFEGVDKDGSGFMFGAGIRTDVFPEGRAKVNAYGLFNYLSEKYSDIDLDVSIIELHLGATMNYALNYKFQPFFGLELVPFSDGEAKMGDYSGDFERDDLFNLKFGATMNLDKVNLQASLTAMAEQTFALSALMRF